MKLIITQPEIESIVRAHVLNTVQLREGADVKIDFTATRGEDGIVATIDIPYMGLGGIPAIAEANAAAAAEAAVDPPAPLPAMTGKPAAAPKRATKANAGSILGGGTIAATEAVKNPEPAAAEAQAETTPETAQDAASEGQAAETDAAPAETPVEAQADAPEATEAAPAPARGPSLFGSFLTR